MLDNFKVGDLVWAKMHPFVAWPARITMEKPFLTKPARPSQCVFFFGTRDYNYVENANIKPYLEYKNKFSKSCQSKDFVAALEDIEDFIQRKEKEPDYDPEANLPAPKTSGENEEAVEEEEEEEVEKVVKKPKETRKRGRGSSKAAPEPKVAKNETTTAASNTNKNGAQTDDAEKSSSITKKNFESSSNASNKDVAYKPVLGVLGIGQLGKTVAMGFAKKHKVNIWNRTPEKAEKFKEQADEKYPGKVNVCERPSDVLRNSDIVFSCVTDSTAVKNIAYGSYYGLFHEIDKMDNKSYVELSNIGIEASIDMSKLIESRGGRYLEAQLQRSVASSEDDKFIILTAGNEQVYLECDSAFKAIANTVFYLGNAGLACKMNLIMQVIKGVGLIGLNEGFELARKCNLTLEDVQEIFNITTMNSPFLQQMANDIVKSGTTFDDTIVHLHNDIKNVLEFSDILNQPLMMTASVREAIITHLNSN